MQRDLENTATNDALEEANRNLANITNVLAGFFGQVSGNGNGNGHNGPAHSHARTTDTHCRADKNNTGTSRSNVDCYEQMLRETVAELAGLRSQAKQQKGTAAHYVSLLDTYEKENQQLSTELESLRKARGRAMHRASTDPATHSSRSTSDDGMASGHGDSSAGDVLRELAVARAGEAQLKAELKAARARNHTTHILLEAAEVQAKATAAEKEEATQALRAALAEFGAEEHRLQGQVSIQQMSLLAKELDYRHDIRGLETELFLMREDRDALADELNGLSVAGLRPRRDHSADMRRRASLSGLDSLESELAAFGSTGSGTGSASEGAQDWEELGNIKQEQALLQQQRGLQAKVAQLEEDLEGKGTLLERVMAKWKESVDYLMEAQPAQGIAPFYNGGVERPTPPHTPTPPHAPSPSPLPLPMFPVAPGLEAAARRGLEPTHTSIHIPTPTPTCQSGREVSLGFTSVACPDGVHHEFLQGYKTASFQTTTPTPVRTLLRENDAEGLYTGFIAALAACPKARFTGSLSRQDMANIVEQHRAGFAAKGVDVFLCSKAEWHSTGRDGVTLELVDEGTEVKPRKNSAKAIVYKWLEFVDMARSPEGYEPEHMYRGGKIPGGSGIPHTGSAMATISASVLKGLFFSSTGTSSCT